MLNKIANDIANLAEFASLKQIKNNLSLDINIFIVKILYYSSFDGKFNVIDPLASTALPYLR